MLKAPRTNEITISMIESCDVKNSFTILERKEGFFSAIF